MSKLQTKLIFLVSITSAFLLLSINALAEYISPDTLEVKTPKYELDKNYSLPLGTYTYKITWQGIPVANATIKVNRYNQDAVEVYEIVAETKTNGAISIFYSLNHTSASLVSTSDFSPIKFTSYQTENSKKTLVNIDFAENRDLEVRQWKNGSENFNLSFNPKNQTLDPLTAAFFARSIKYDVGSNAIFDVLNGKNRFLIRFDVSAKERLTVGDKEVDAFKAIPSVEKMTDSKGENRLNSAAIWITADNKRDIVKMESSVLIGKVTAKLVSFEPFVAPVKYVSAFERLAPMVKPESKLARLKISSMGLS